MTTILSAKHISLAQQHRSILDDVSFQIDHPQVVSIMGVNGAGKSTLLKALSLDGPLQRGELCLFSQSREKWNRAELAKVLSVLPQNTALNFSFRVHEVVRLGRIPHSSGALVDQGVVDLVLSELDIVHLKNVPYTSLSGGEKQRVQLARVIAQLLPDDKFLSGLPHKGSDLRTGNNGELSSLKKTAGFRALLLLDEPTNALDIAHQHALMFLLARLKALGVAVVMVLHDFNLAAQYSDRILLLHERSLYMDADPKTVFMPAVLKEVFQIESNILPHPVSRRPVITV